MSFIAPLPSAWFDSTTIVQALASVVVTVGARACVLWLHQRRMRTRRALLPPVEFAHRARIAELREQLALQPKNIDLMNRTVANPVQIAELYAVLDDIEESMITRIDAAWALTNLASSTAEVTHCLVDHAGAIDVLVRHAHNAHLIELAEQCIWCLGNIAGECIELRDRVIEANACNAIVKVCSAACTAGDISCVETCTWSLSNLCRGSRHASMNIELVHQAALACFHTRSHSCVLGALNMISYTARYKDVDVMDDMLSKNLLTHIMDVFDIPECTHRVFRIAGDVSSMDEAIFTSALVNAGALVKAQQTLSKKPREDLVASVAFMIANILTDGHVHDAISTGVVHALVQAHAACKSDAAVRECGVALCEAAISTKGSDDRLGLFNCGVLKVIQAYIFQEDSSSMHEQACRALTKMSV